VIIGNEVNQSTMSITVVVAIVFVGVIIDLVEDLVRILHPLLPHRLLLTPAVRVVIMVDDDHLDENGEILATRDERIDLLRMIMIHERVVLRAVIETKVADIIVMIVGRDRMIAMIDDLDRKKDAMVVVVVGVVETIINTVDAIVVAVIMMIIVVTKWKKEEQIEKLPPKNN